MSAAVDRHIDVPTCMDAVMAFNGQRLAVIRKAFGYDSQLALAKELGKPASTVMRWEADTTNPGADDLYAVADILNVSCEEFAKAADAPIRWKRIRHIEPNGGDD